MKIRSIYMNLLLSGCLLVGLWFPQAALTWAASPRAPDALPVAVDDQGSTLEDTPTTIDVLANDSDPDGNLDPTSVTIVSGAANGATSVETLTGKVTYTPHLYFHGQDSFIYQVCDTMAACAQANVTIEVIFVNHLPVANDDLATTPEDSAVTINVTANDTDVDGNLDPTTVIIIRPVVNGSTSVNPLTGSVTYLGHLHYNGTDGFSYQVCDTYHACSTANVNIIVTPVNYPPIANDDSTSTLENTPVTVDVLANDTDPDGVDDLVPSSVKVVSQPGEGTTLVDPASGAITYNPSKDYFGPDSFRYRVYDHAGAYDEANVSIDMVNQLPVANPDSATTPEDTAKEINVSENDTDPEGSLDPASVKVVNPPSNGSAALISPAGTILYTPNLNFNGVDSFVYQICDTGKPGLDGTPPLCASAKVTVTVTPVNDRPVATADTFFMNQDDTLTVNAPGVLENDNDVDNPVITAVLEQEDPAHGKLKLKGDGSFTYTPQKGFAGQDTFSYHAYDGYLASDNVTVTITVYDTEPPKIIQWLQPELDNSRIYYVATPMVTLEVTATDNVAVDRVRFSRWDPVNKEPVNIASIQVAPYLWQLDTSTLVLGFNQVYTRAYDPSGNDSGQDNSIWLLVVTRWLYLPVMIR